MKFYLLLKREISYNENREISVVKREMNHRLIQKTQEKD